MGGGGVGGVDVEELPMLGIKCCQYISSRAKCAHVLCALFYHSRYDEVEVLNDGFLVYVKYTSAFSLVVAPRGEKFGGKMFARVAYQFVNKG